MFTRRSFGRAVSVLASAAVLPAFAKAASYPTKPVTMVVSFAPGGMTDAMARLIGGELAKSLGQPFLVDNRPGAAGRVGTEYVAQKSPDGYTLLLSATGHVIGPAVQKVNYRPVEDFSHIAILARTSNLLLVHKSVPASSVAEFLDWSRSQQQIPYATAGFGGATHLAGETLRMRSGLPYSHVAYRGASPAVTDLISGQVKVAFLDSMTAMPFLANGDIKAIATTDLERSPLFAGIPTLNESGFPGFDLYTWIGMYAPAGTPPDIVRLLNREANRAVTTPKAMEWLKENNCQPGGNMSPEEFKLYVEQETKKWKDVVTTSGIQVE